MNKQQNKKNFFGKVFPPKVFIVFFTGFLANVLLSGCSVAPYSENEIPFEYNTIQVTGIDNRGRSAVTSDGTMRPSAVAFSLTMSDSTIRHHDFGFHNPIQSLFFTPAMAFSPAYYYVPTNRVVRITVTTLFDIDENFRANADISSLIVYSLQGENWLYKNANYALATINGPQDSPGISLFMVLRETIENTQARFNFRVTFEDGAELSVTTDTFTIIP